MSAGNYPNILRRLRDSASILHVPMVIALSGIQLYSNIDYIVNTKKLASES